MIKEYNKITAQELTNYYSAEIFDFADTSELKPEDKMIGQDRAIQAIDFGLLCKNPEYNIFLAGAVGTGKTSYACRAAHKIAATELPAQDWCYVHNFKKASKPMALSFKPGEGEVFAKDIKHLFEQVSNKLKDMFKSDDYDKTKMALFKELQTKQEALWDEFSAFAEMHEVMVQWASKEARINMTPLYEGNVIIGDDLQKLPKEIREKVNEKIFIVQEAADEMVRRSQNLEELFVGNMKKVEEKFVMQFINEYFLALREKYKDNNVIDKYLDDITQAILKNLHYFKTEPPDTEDEQLNQTLMAEKRNFKIRFRNYFTVNVLVDNSNSKGAPVIYETNPTYQRLTGKIEYKNAIGVLSTNHNLIKPGAIQRANGGYLILNAYDLFKNPLAWEGLKRALKSGYIEVENLSDQFTGVNIITLKPERIPINIKVLLIGNNYIYNMLKTRDADFGKLFKIYADFEDDMENNKENAFKLANFIAYKAKEKKLAAFTRDAVAKILQHSCYIAGSQKKLTTYFNEVLEVAYQADVWRKVLGKTLVDEECVVKAKSEMNNRVNRYELYLQEMVQQGKILLDTTGKAIGQINGLAVLSTVDYIFGNVSKITANTYLGTDGVINIEREIKMSGTSHSKGVLILSSYLGEKYAQDIPLTLSASLTFEQLYSGIDGDSASSAELYALLSAIGKIPLKQHIAVTGSVNQKGEIQPIGGVSEKITGFFELCKQRGLDGSHGVMIPGQNVDELILADEIVAAIADEKFHIYPVWKIDQGIEILTDLPAGKLEENGCYPEGTVHKLVSENLRKNSEKLRELDK